MLLTRTAQGLLAAAATVAMVAIPATVDAQPKPKPPAPFSNTKILIQKSVGGIELGDTAAEVNHKLHRKLCKANGSCAYTAAHNAYSVSLILAAKSKNATAHVARITLDAGSAKPAADALRTSRGIGLGSTLKQARKAYPNAKATKYGISFGDPSNAGTSFYVENGHVVEVFMQNQHIG